MDLTVKLSRAVAVLSLIVAPALLAQQERPVQRVATIVSVATEEYGKGIDEKGRLISQDEYQEAVGFLADARIVSQRLPGNQTAPRALLDSIIAAVNAKRPPSIVAELNKRFEASLGRDAALDLPKQALDIAEGRRLYQSTCASCHGTNAMGDGPAAATLSPKPPAIGSATAMFDVSPAMMFRKMSVGVTGTAMPPWIDYGLTVKDAGDLLNYIRSLTAPPSSGKVAAAAPAATKAKEF